MIDMIELMARSGLDDESFVAAASWCRRADRVVQAAENLAAAVEAAEHYLPDSVVAALGAYRLAGLSDDRVTIA